MTNSILHVEAYEVEVNRIVQDVLMTMAGYPVTPGTEPYCARPDRITCIVYFAGVWNGAVLVECPLPMAFAFTAKIMRIPTPVQIDSDVQDALGELANMVGGNLKSVLPKGVVLSTPSVVEGSNYSLHVCHAHCNNRMAFDGPDGPFWVTLVETDTRRASP